MTNRRLLIRAALWLAIVFAIAPVYRGWSQDGETASAPALARSYLGLLAGVKNPSIVYHRGTDYELKCDIYVPAGVGPFPAVLAVHGGGWRAGSKVNLLRHAIKLCNAGYVVVCINYRHAPKYPFPAQIQDCFVALRFMVENAQTYRIDPNRLYGFGYSAGGHLISLLATTSESDWLDAATDSPETLAPLPQLKGIAAGGAPCDFDWLPEDSPFLSYWLCATKADDGEIYERASPVCHVSRESPPFLLFHGADDQIVPVACVERMQKSLHACGVVCEVVQMPRSGHFETFSNLETVDQAIAFFARHSSRKKD